MSDRNSRLVHEARNAFLDAVGRENLHIDIPQDLPPVMADRRRVVQVLSNLLSNAARHAPPSSSIRLTAVEKEIHVAFSVADEGRGIAADRLPHLFGKYSRPEGGNREGDLPGSGLDLAICRGIVEAHGGRIWAESEGRDLGAQFTFTIPVAEEASPAPGRPDAHSRGRAEELARILMVGDDPQTPQACA